MTQGAIGGQAQKTPVHRMTMEPDLNPQGTRLNTLRATLRRWGRWLSTVEGPAWGAWGLTAGLALALALALLSRLAPLWMAETLALLTVALAMGSAAVGLVAPWLRPLPLPRLARIFDRRLALAERLTTAWELAAGRLHTSPALVDAQWADTLSVVAAVNIRQALPLRLPRRPLLLALLLTGAVALSLALPNPQETVLQERAALRAAVEEQVAALEEAHTEIAQMEGLDEAQRAALLQALEEAIAALEEGRATPEEAMAALAQAERSLAPLQDPGAARLQADLERAAGQMSDSPLTQEIAAALAQGDFGAAAEALAAFAGSKGETLTRDQELELARELAQAAEALASSDPELAQQLSAAAEAIEQGDIAAARQAITQAAQRMAQAGGRVQAQQAVEETLATLQQGRQEIAQASGQASDQSARAGSQPGQGQQPGSGQGAAGSGGNQAGSDGPGQPGHHEDSGTGAPYDELYVPYRLDEEGTPVEIGRSGDEGQPVGDSAIPAPQTGQARVPYRQVYADYAGQAAAALEGSYIPLGMKQYVRDYFSSLEP